MFEHHATARLRLERLTAEHVEDLFRLHTDPAVMATLGGVRSREETEAMLHAATAHWGTYGFGLWMLYDIDSGRFAGRGGLKHASVEGCDEVEVAYGLMPELWGRGLATELARESVRIGFEALNLSHLVCFTLTTNQASQRVMQKVGFRYERDFVHAGLPHVLYRLLRADWLQAQAS